ncbi:MAG: hypothetical protein H0U72_10255 [Nitrosospira sp.]|nr:hypothetical protein [Nitrosospira sp.]
MPFINLQGADASRIINCRVLEVPDLATFLSFEIKEFHIDLHMMTRHLFLITDGCNRPFGLAVRQAIQGMALQFLKVRRVSGALMLAASSLSATSPAP